MLIFSENKDVKLEERIGKALGKVGPSILLTSCSEIFCFAIGTISQMPAVKTFAIYATLAIFLDFFLQITAFVALLSVDQERYENNRMEIAFCVKAKTPKIEAGRAVYKIWKTITPYIMKYDLD